jgi:hypothetical protein
MKTIVLLTALSITLFGVEWLSFEKAYAISHKHKNPILVLVTKKGCPYCAKSMHDFATEASLNMATPLLHVTIDSVRAQTFNIIPQQFPALYLLNYRGDVMIEPVQGYSKAKETARYLSDFVKQYMKYVEAGQI